MHSDPDFLQNLNRELKDVRSWVDRSIVLAYAAVAGLSVVAFTMLAEKAFAVFEKIFHWQGGWLVLLWMPCLTAGIVWVTRRFAPGAAGSGIPQVSVALDARITPAQRGRFVSLRLSVAKIFLSSAGFLAGLSIGREGPSVQVAAGVMQHAQRWLKHQSRITGYALLIAGGAAGIAAAFNAPLAGVVFAIEELSRKLESMSSGLVIAAIVLAGLMGVSFFGNLSYFGRIQVPTLGWTAIGPSLLVVVLCGALGGLFAKLMAMSLTQPQQRLNQWRARFPIRFAAVLGLALAVMGLATGGATFGSGSEQVQHMLSGDANTPAIFVTLKFIATWLSAWTGAPGGIFAPSLSIGAGVGQNISVWVAPELAPALIAMGMAAFLAAVTQAPLTAFIIVMEMIDGHSMVLSLMTAAMLASLISRMLARPLYETLAEFMVTSVQPPQKPEPNPEAVPSDGQTPTQATAVATNKP